MIDLKERCIATTSTISDALFRLNELHKDLTLFVVTDGNKLAGTLTDGDIRRGILARISTEDRVEKVMERNFSYLRKGSIAPEAIESIRAKGITLVPVLDRDGRIIKVLNLAELNGPIPVDTVLMAGGEGKRLRPLTDSIPKSLLPIGDKPIMEHLVDQLVNYGVEHFHVCIGYRGDQIVSHFRDGSSKGIQIEYIRETEPMGTIGAVRNIHKFASNHVLVINSDILTRLDFASFYADFIANDADVSVAAVPYKVSIPYAVLETHAGEITGLKEKPTYTYYSNAGIYLMKREVFEFINNGYANATDLLDTLIQKKKKVIYFKLQAYWMDIGNHDDYRKANEDIKQLR